jgi:hypothetical protein
MLNHRKTIGLLVSAILLLAGRAHAQGMMPSYALGDAPYSNPDPGQHKPWQPFNPVGFETEMQPFAPADISEYGNGPKPRTGFFASYERLYWTISKPGNFPVGNPDLEGPTVVNGIPTLLVNSFDTDDFMKPFWAWGNRYELGYMDCNDYGWLVSGISHLHQGQVYNLLDAQVLFNDPGNLLLGFTDVNGDGLDDDLNGNGVFGRDGIDTDGDGVPDTAAPVDPLDTISFPARYDFLQATNETVLDGVEVMRMYRAPRLHDGGTFELLYGVRYMHIMDHFIVDAIGGFLDESVWDTKVENDIVGPQIGGRYSNQRGRWIFSAEGRLFAAANFIRTQQRSVIATNFVPTGAPGEPVNLTPFGAQDSDKETEFAPGGEIRFQTVYQLTQSVGLKLGYTAMLIDNVSRASNRIDYTLPDFGVLNINTNEDIFFQGISFGIEINR